MTPESKARDKTVKQRKAILLDQHLNQKGLCVLWDMKSDASDDMTIEVKGKNYILIALMRDSSQVSQISEGRQC